MTTRPSDNNWSASRQARLAEKNMNETRYYIRTLYTYNIIYIMVRDRRRNREHCGDYNIYTTIL